MLRRFFDYTNKLFDFSKKLSEITDTRVKPQIKIQSILMSSVIMLATRLGSLNALKVELRLPKKVECFIGKDKPSDKTIGNVFAKINPDDFRKLHLADCYKLKRNKVLETDLPFNVLGVDGHEFFTTKKRRWLGFCVRMLQTKKGEVPEFYYRASVCSLLNTQIDLPLDLEPVLPGENEIASSKRLIQRLHDNYTRLFDCIAADAIYFEGPFVNFCLSIGKDVIAVLKDNYPSLLEDARGVFSQMTPETWYINGRTIQVWDAEGFITDTIDVPLRVVHAVETYIEKFVDKDGKADYREVTVNWWWATTITKSRLSTKGVWRIGHSRWQVENNTFNTLGQHWCLNHCYNHDPVAIINFILALFMVFALVQCFYKRNLKPPMRKIINSVIALANQLYAGLSFDCGEDIAVPSGPGPPR